MCRRIEPQVGERVKEFRRVDFSGYEPGQGKGLKTSNTEVSILNQQRKLNLELSLSSVFSRMET